MAGKVTVPALLLPIVLAAACQHAPPKPAFDPERYAREDAEWKARRLRSIAGPDGWITLAGLYWLESKSYTVGGAGADIPLPGAERVVGTLQVDSGQPRFTVAPGARVTLGDSVVTAVALQTDRDGAKPTVLAVGGTTFRVLDRSGRLAVRVKDSASALRREFAGIPAFPIDPAFRVLARLERPAEPRVLHLANIVGLIEDHPVAGTLHFTLAGEPRTLVAVTEPGDSSLFILFRDSTSQSETYQAGRFLDAPPPDSAGFVLLDFNRAYNPPCAFTAFATCPLPPPENLLPIPIRAGERRYNGGHGAVALAP